MKASPSMLRACGANKQSAPQALSQWLSETKAGHFMTANANCIPNSDIRLRTNAFDEEVVNFAIEIFLHNFE